MDVKGDVITFLSTSLTQPSSLMVGRFKSEVASSGDISRIAITVPMKIHGFEEIIYEQNEYNYDNDDSISKWIVLSFAQFLLIQVVERCFSTFQSNSTISILVPKVVKINRYLLSLHHMEDLIAIL